MRKEILIIAIIVAVIAFATAATAATTGMTVSHVANDTATVASADSVVAIGGNITNIDVDATLQSSNWAGFFGDVTGTLTLAGASNTFYSWGSINTGYILFANASTVNWAGGIAAGNGATITAEDTATGLTGLTDSISNTFTDTTDLSGATIGVTVGLGSPVSANSTSTGQDWPTYLLTAGSTRLYGTTINQTGLDYAGNAADFQLLVPTGASRTYYVFADLQ
jgi:hypothetical protein